MANNFITTATATRCNHVLLPCRNFCPLWYCWFFKTSRSRRSLMERNWFSMMYPCTHFPVLSLIGLVVGSRWVDNRKTNMHNSRLVALIINSLQIWRDFFIMRMEISLFLWKISLVTGILEFWILNFGILILHWIMGMFLANGDGSLCFELLISFCFFIHFLVKNFKSKKCQQLFI